MRKITKFNQSSISRLSTKNKYDFSYLLYCYHKEYRFFIYQFLIILFLFSFSGCTTYSVNKKNVNVQHTRISTLSEYIQSTAIKENTTTIMPSSTVENTPSPDTIVNKYPDNSLAQNYKNLPKGNYIVYSENNVGMSVLSEDGSITQLLSDSISGIPISFDGRTMQKWGYLGISDTTIDLENGIVSIYPYEGVISPDQKYFAFTNFPNSENYQLSLINAVNGKTCIVDIEVPESDNSNELIELPSNIQWLSNVLKNQM